MLCGETEDERGAPGNGNLRVKTWRHCRRKQRGHGGGRHSSQRELRRERASLGLSHSGGDKRQREAESGRQARREVVQGPARRADGPLLLCCRCGRHEKAGAQELGVGSIV